MPSAALASLPLPAERSGDSPAWQAPLRLVHDATPPPVAAPASESAAQAARRLRVRDDDDLLRLAAGARAEPFSVLFERHGVEVFRYCLAMTSHRDDAADASQDAWMRAFAALRRQPFEARPFRPWIYAIARNACIDRLRGRNRASFHELDEAQLPPVACPEQERAAREEVRNVLADLARLPLLQRSEILMRDLAGLSHEEISRELRISVPRSRALAGEARSFLHDRRAGRAMPCGDVRNELGRPRQGRNRRLRAHLDDCELCAAFERRGRARRLSSLALAPVALLRGFVERAAAWLGAPAFEGIGGVASRGVAGLAAAAATVGGGTAALTHDPAPPTLRAAVPTAVGAATARGGERESDARPSTPVAPTRVRTRSAGAAPADAPASERPAAKPTVSAAEPAAAEPAPAVERTVAAVRTTVAAVTPPAPAVEQAAGAVEKTVATVQTAASPVTTTVSAVAAAASLPAGA